MALEDVFKGFGGHNFAFPKIAGAYQKKSIVVCADAACVWDDLERFGCVSRVGRGGVYKAGWDFMTINRMVQIFPGNIEHAYSNETDLLEAFVRGRRAEYRHEFERPRHLHSCDPRSSQRGVWRWPWSGRGTSGLGGALVAVALGYNEVVLAGMPLDNSAHNGEPPWRKCRFDKEAPEAVDHNWKEAIRFAFSGRVTSLSGRTMTWLGAPRT